MSEVRVGDRVRVESRKLGQAVREGVVTEVLGLLLRVRWSSGLESTFTPGPGSVTVVGRTDVQASKPAWRNKTAGLEGRHAEEAALTVQRDLATVVTPPRPRNRKRHGLWTWFMVVVLRRAERVACTECGASYPAFFKGHQCLICDSAIDVGGRKRKGAGAMTMKQQGARKAPNQDEAQVAALQAECDELRAALGAAGDQRRTVGVSDYEWHVELAAKGLAQRDRYPMPPSVTTPAGFYEVMAGAALDAAGLRDLLERVARAERNLEDIQNDASRRGGAEAENDSPPNEDR